MKDLMPEPVAWRNWSALTGKCSLSFDCHSELASDALITTTQAEAYADARVREVLRSLLRDMNGHVRAAHSRFGETGKPYDEGRRIAYEQAAADIRALIPPLPGPVEP